MDQGPRPNDFNWTGTRVEPGLGRDEPPGGLVTALTVGELHAKIRELGETEVELAQARASHARELSLAERALEQERQFRAHLEEADAAREAELAQARQDRAKMERMREELEQLRAERAARKGK